MNCPFCDNSISNNNIEFKYIVFDGKENYVLACPHCGFSIKTLTQEEEQNLFNLVTKIVKRKKC